MKEISEILATLDLSVFQLWHEVRVKALSRVQLAACAPKQCCEGANITWEKCRIHVPKWS